MGPSPIASIYSPVDVVALVLDLLLFLADTSMGIIGSPGITTGILKVSYPIKNYLARINRSIICIWGAISISAGGGSLLGSPPDPPSPPAGGAPGGVQPGYGVFVVPEDAGILPGIISVVIVAPPTIFRPKGMVQADH